MRDDRSGVEVRVLLSRQSTTCREWKAPLSSPYHSSHGRRTFIEARAEEPYEIHTTINTNFDWAATKHLLISYKIDGQAARKVSVSKDDFRSSNRGIVPAHDVCKSCKFFVGGALQRCSLVFRSSALVDEPQFLSTDEEEYDLTRRGKLEVRVQRVKPAKRKKPTTESVARSDPQTLLMRPESNKKIIMDNGRSHFTRFVAQGVVCPGRRSGTSSERVWTPVRGPAGKGLKFEIYYTSEMFLCREDMIPNDAVATTENYTSVSSEKANSGNDLVKPSDATTTQPRASFRQRDCLLESSGPDIAVIDLTGPEVEHSMTSHQDFEFHVVPQGGRTDETGPRQCRIADIID